jgi:hypothetical protein
VADYLYSANFINGYGYAQAKVTVTYGIDGPTFKGRLQARGLKPNFAYQLKLEGIPDLAHSKSNELIGLAGRWWQEEWSGNAWMYGQNINDEVYFTNRDIEDLTSPTGLRYRITGYMVFDYFITDGTGAVVLKFEAKSRYHVLRKTTERAPTPQDGPVKTATFDPSASSWGYDSDYPQATVGIFGEWERLPVGGITLGQGNYDCYITLTEESFHGSGGTYAGNWAAAMTGTISFSINP